MVGVEAKTKSFGWDLRPGPGVEWLYAPEVAQGSLVKSVPGGWMWAVPGMLGTQP